MRDWFIKEIIRILEKLEVGKIPTLHNSSKYVFISTQDSPFGTNYGEWFDYRKSGINTLQDSKIAEGWQIAYIWHTTIGSTWHTNWVLSKSPHSSE